MNNCVTVKFGTKVSHDKLIPHAKQNSKISTDIIDNDLIMSKFECFRQKALNFKMLHLNETLQNLVGLLILIVVDSISEVGNEKIFQKCSC